MNMCYVRFGVDGNDDSKKANIDKLRYHKVVIMTPPEHFNLLIFCFPTEKTFPGGKMCYNKVI